MPDVVLSLCLSILCLSYLSLGAQWLGEREFRTLSKAQVASLVSSPDPVKNLDPANRASHLSKILIPRSPDTNNNTQVKNYIVSTLRKLDWDIEEDSFKDNTPYGVKHFTNVIATKDPEAPRRVIVAAHFDSKFYSTYPDNQAEALDPLLNRRKEQLEEGLIDDEDVAETTLQLVFFDGEEAYMDWTATDSVYGARHLAEKWATTYIPPNTKRRLRNSATELATIEHLILLDLLGAKNPLVQSYFIDTAWLFDALVSAERRLVDAGVVTATDNAEPDAWRSFFAPRLDMNNHGFISDDHIPFMQRGVSILHVISSPFPRVWHTLLDDASALDLETMMRWNLIMRVFMCEYLGLQPDSNIATLKRDNEELHPRAAAPVRFSMDDGADEFGPGMGLNLDAGDDGDDNVMDMITIMQEFQKKKSMKANSRSAAFMHKKDALIAAARKEAETMVRDGHAYIEQCKARLVEMRAQETPANEVLKDAIGLWAAHEDSFQSLLSIFPELIEDLSPKRAHDINAASELLETHPLAREASRRRLMKNARKDMEEGISNQKVWIIYFLLVENPLPTLFMVFLLLSLRRTLRRSSNITRLCCCLRLGDLYAMLLCYAVVAALATAVPVLVRLT
ncbi:hypothetical protein EW145_g296 [Phellinidium pouzarii]|uniref:Peptide hydrolase n=1 Tax=Phellinidium pouzarii TaxID=167371 RepID=A0A4S4LKR7_9AGAM|nr:hypothetical protein EW145_g296 [Phellinidium pouzarii]